MRWCAVSVLHKFGARSEEQILLPLVDDFIVLIECPQTVTLPNFLTLENFISNVCRTNQFIYLPVSVPKYTQMTHPRQFYFHCFVDK